MTEVMWNRMTAAELRARAAADALVLLPVASTEQHGPQLATGCDSFLATEGCRRTALLVAKHRPVVVAPTLWVGLAEHHVAFGGTFTLSLATYHAVVRELCSSILRAGFKRILVVNAHGGNMAALTAMTTDLTRELGAPVATTTLYTLPHAAKAYAPVLETQEGVQHACEAETSMMMAAFPDCVRREKLAEATGALEVKGSALSRPLLTWKSFKDITPSGVVGDARPASPEKGEKLLDIAASLLAERLIAGEPWA